MESNRLHASKTGEINVLSEIKNYHINEKYILSDDSSLFLLVRVATKNFAPTHNAPNHRII